MKTEQVTPQPLLHSPIADQGSGADRTLTGHSYSVPKPRYCKWIEMGVGNRAGVFNPQTPQIGATDSFTLFFTKPVDMMPEGVLELTHNAKIQFSSSAQPVYTMSGFEVSLTKKQ